VRIVSLSSFFIHMDIRRDGIFECEDPLLSRINAVFQQTLLCNMHSGLVMDCPHREKLPYTGDGKLVMKSAYYNNNVTQYYYKWFRDILDAQTGEGLIPNSAPYFGGGGGYAWGNALCTVAKQLYAWTGDLTVAAQGYKAICKWLDYYESKRDADYVIRSNSHTWMLGDWLAPEPVISNVYYISTVCYLQAVKTALFFAQILDRSACEKWQQLIAAIQDGIHRVFFDENALTYGNGVQGENMLALAENIVPEAYRERMEAKLRHHYSVQTDYHLDTGIVLTPVLLDYLTVNGCRDIAWEIMTAKTYPSYFNLMEGDSTFSEHWSKKWPDYYLGEPKNSRLVKGGGDLSHCHPMYGSVVAWLYEKVAGLDLSALYRREILVTPYFMDRLTWAKAQKMTDFGEACVNWVHSDGAYQLQICVPAGLSAKCCFPAECKRLKNAQTGEIYESDEKGFFSFSLTAGRWNLINIGAEK
jgi:alpha-L-rhamnosidase